MIKSKRTKTDLLHCEMAVPLDLDDPVEDVLDQDEEEATDMGNKKKEEEEDKELSGKVRVVLARVPGASSSSWRSASHTLGGCSAHRGPGGSHSSRCWLFVYLCICCLLFFLCI